MKHNQGFTFIEVILYMAIVSIMLVTLIPFAWNMMTGGTKSSVQQEFYTAARIASERIKYEIRNATGLNTAISSFDVNLATTANSKLSLAQSAPSNPTEFSIQSGNLMLTQGSNPAVALNPKNTRITNLTFSNYSSTDNKTKNVSFVLTVDAAYLSQRQEYTGSITLRSSAEIRTN